MTKVRPGELEAFIQALVDRVRSYPEALHQRIFEMLLVKCGQIVGPSRAGELLRLGRDPAPQSDTGGD